MSSGNIFLVPALCRHSAVSPHRSRDRHQAISIDRGNNHRQNRRRSAKSAGTARLSRGALTVPALRSAFKTLSSLSIVSVRDFSTALPLTRGHLVASAKYPFYSASLPQPTARRPDRRFVVPARTRARFEGIRMELELVRENTRLRDATFSLRFRRHVRFLSPLEYHRGRGRVTRLH